jgi:CO dehydrogenase/acetyl-CoA synthase epsilon subunit
MSLNYDGNKKLVIIGSAKGDQNILDFISKLKKGKEIKNAIVKSMFKTDKDKDNSSNLKNFIIDTIINTEQPKKEKEG